MGCRIFNIFEYRACFRNVIFYSLILRDIVINFHVRVSISDGDQLGGCKPGAGTDCLDSSLSCVTSSGTHLHGTCILTTGQVPGGFGDGECRTGQIKTSRISLNNKYPAGT